MAELHAASSLAPADPLQHSEHVSNVLRLRKAAALALVAWPAFALSDWFLVTFVEPSGRLWVYLLLRVLGLALIVPVFLRLRLSRLPSPRALLAMDTATCVTLTTLISISCVEFRGIESPLALGVATLLVARAALLADHWRRGWLPVGLTALAHPTVLLALGAFSNDVAAQLRDERAVAMFAFQQMFVLAAAALTLIGGHTVWKLRRQVFEARSLGRYKLQRRIGRGGMGEVWRAHHTALKRDVAVKILRPRDQELDSLAVARFEREARATSELSHPNTIRVFDYGVTDDGLFYYAMELLQGYDVGALIRRAPVAPDRAVDLILQASRALAEAHGRGIVHRDIKPENLFVTQPEGHAEFVKVLDFGLARVVVEDNQPAGLTRAGWAVGTPSYIAPEIVLGEQADARSDVYALGTVLYQLLCGQLPFARGDMRTVLRARVRERPAPPSHKLRQPLPAQLERVVMCCLEREPARRYGSAAALAAALEELDLRSPVPVERTPAGVSQPLYESGEVTLVDERPAGAGAR